MRVLWPMRNVILSNTIGKSGMLLRRVTFVLAAGVLPVTMLSGCGGGSGGEGGGSGSQAPFTVAAESSASGTQGSAFLLPVDLTRHPGFSDNVEVTLDNPPAGVHADTIVFDDETTSALLPITIAKQATLGNHALNVVGKSQSASHAVPVTLAVGASQSTAQEKIAEALQAGTLDYGTSLLYRAYALFGDRRLSSEYQSTSSQDDNSLLDEILEAMETIPAEIQVKLEPFIVRPADPASVWNAVAPTATGVAALHGAPHLAIALAGLPPLAQCPPPSGGNTTEWASKRSNVNPVRVWAKCESVSDYDAKSQTIIDKTLTVLDAIYGPMTKLMEEPHLDKDGGDDAIDFYIVDPSTYVFREDRKLRLKPGYRGVTYNASPNKDKGSSAVVLLQRDGTRLKGFHNLVIEEFFHVLQKRHNRQFGIRPIGNGSAIREKHWFIEASANWAAAHFDRTLKDSWGKGRAAKALPYWLFEFFFQGSNAGLNNTKEPEHDRGAYIWPYFVEQELKDDGNFMRKIWTELEGVTTFEQADDVIDSVHSFVDHFKTFALRNLNMAFLPGDPLPFDQRYVSLDKDQFPDGVGPKFDNVAELVTDKPFEQSLNLEPLSARYIPVIRRDTPQGGVQKVEFDFTGLKPQDLTDIQLLVHTTDSHGIPQWVKPPFDESSADKVVFCLSEGPTTPTHRRDFSEIIMVVSNHGKRDKVSGTLVARPVSKPCATVWNVKTKFRHTAIDGDVTWNTESTFEFDDKTPQLPGRITHRLRSGTYSVEIRVPAGACIITTRGAGTMVPEPALTSTPGSTAFAKFVIDTTMTPNEFGGGGSTNAAVTGSDCDGKNFEGPYLIQWGGGGLPQTVSNDGNTVTGSFDRDFGNNTGNEHGEYEFTKSSE